MLQIYDKRGSRDEEALERQFFAWIGHEIFNTDMVKRASSKESVCLDIICMVGLLYFLVKTGRRLETVKYIIPIQY